MTGLSSLIQKKVAHPSADGLYARAPLNFEGVIRAQLGLDGFRVDMRQISS